MSFKLEDRLTPTNSHHSDMVDAMAYWIAEEEARIQNEYVLLHIRKRPWWFPEFFYRWFLSNILVIDRFIAA